MKTSQIHTMLRIALILGVVQGLLTLIGGLISVYDGNNDLNGSLLRGIGPKYICGLVRYERATLTLYENCDPGKMDRGWFERVHNYCKNGDCHENFKKLRGYSTIMAFSILCGIGWFVAGILAYCSSKYSKGIYSLISAIIFAVLYIIFIGLFISTWKSIRMVDDDCASYLCNKFKKGAKRSSREFLGYSICAFILILISIVLTIVPAFATWGRK